jgi:hypothetical protein
MPHLAPRKVLILVVLAAALAVACDRPLTTEVHGQVNTISKVAAACPSVSCLTETGYHQCVDAGCKCDERNDFCVPIPPPPPPPMCPSVSCLTQQGYDQCIAVGCGCHPRTDQCVAKTAIEPIGGTSDLKSF